MLVSEVLSIDLNPHRTLINFHETNNHREGVTRKRTLENQDELIRTSMTPDGGNLPTKLPTILKWGNLNPRLNLLDKNLNLYIFT